MVLNGLFFGLYLGAFKPLVTKYSTITFMRWMFLFSTIVGLPMVGKELVEIDYAAFSGRFLFDLAFTVFGATFIAYTLIPIGQKRLRPTVVSVYSYIQPIIAASMSIYLQMDVLNWQKILAATLVFTGVILVNKSKAKDNA